MNPDSKKNRKLIKQYPFISDILSQRMEPHGNRSDFLKGNEKYPGWVDDKMTFVDDLTIQVQKADGDLMYRRADNVGLDDGSCFHHFSGKREGQISKRGEYLFAIDKNGEIVNRLNWPRNRHEDRNNNFEKIYGCHVFWSKKKGHEHYSDPIWGEIEYLIWVTVDAYYKEKKDEEQIYDKFGEFLERSVAVTIYSEPKQGFEELDRQSNVYSNLSLDSSLVTHGIVEGDSQILTMCGMLNEMCFLFQEKVYFNGMKEIFDDGEYRGASGKFGSVEVLCGEMCGNDRIMLEDSQSYVTFQLRPETSNLYVHAQRGTAPQIRNLVWTVVDMWNEKPELRSNFKPNENISVL